MMTKEHTVRCARRQFVSIVPPPKSSRHIVRSGKSDSETQSDAVRVGCLEVIVVGGGRAWHGQEV